MTHPVVAWICAGVLTQTANLHTCEGWTVDRQGHFVQKFWDPAPARAHARRALCERAGATTLDECRKAIRKAAVKAKQ